MSSLLNIKTKIYRGTAITIAKSKLHRYYAISNDGRPNSPFKLAFFCGKSGIEYLNGCLLSIYLSWPHLPEITIVSDGTSPASIRDKMMKWPRETEIITWERAADYYMGKGNHHLSNIAKNKRWPGKKFVSLLYLAERHPILYSDTDVLWFAPPEKQNIDIRPFIKMGKDIGKFYTDYVLKQLNCEKEMDDFFCNSGIMYLNGDFSEYPKWQILCRTLEDNPDTDNFAEQTAFAVLQKFFSGNSYWTHDEALIKIDDMLSLKYTRDMHPDIFARHYVSSKSITFWRDLLRLCLKGKRY